jgi:hypothetical protein
MRVWILQGLATIATVASACGRSEPTPQPVPARPAATTLPPSPRAVASPAATAVVPRAASVPSAPAAAPIAQRGPKNIQEVIASLTKVCDAKELPDDNAGMHIAMRDRNDCRRARLNVELDAVLSPLKSSDPTRFRALMAEQATWNRLVETACNIEEELAFLNFEDGTRSDGTMRGLALMGCKGTAIGERVYYARSRAAADVHAMVRRVREKAKEGTAERRALADRRKLAERWVVAPPPKDPDGPDPQWERFSKDIESVQKTTRALARSTCAAWPELSSALGGAATCERELELYFYVQGSSPPEGNET